MVSVKPLEGGRTSSHYIVTLANSDKAREVKRLFLKEENIHIEDTRGQLVYRPTKSSKLIDTE